MPTIKEIVKEYLEKNGYGGLVLPEFECGCYLDDLFPCDCPSENCAAAYAIECKYHEKPWLREVEIFECDRGDCFDCDGRYLSIDKEPKNAKE